MAAKYQGWRLAPLGAVAAVRTQSSMTSRETARSEKSRTVWRVRMKAWNARAARAISPSIMLWWSGSGMGL